MPCTNLLPEVVSINRLHAWSPLGPSNVFEGNVRQCLNFSCNLQFTFVSPPRSHENFLYVFGISFQMLRDVHMFLLRKTKSSESVTEVRALDDILH